MFFTGLAFNNYIRNLVPTWLYSCLPNIMKKTNFLKKFEDIPHNDKFNLNISEANNPVAMPLNRIKNGGPNVFSALIRFDYLFNKTMANSLNV